jgi:outer membrane biosynthesis protein TonB
MRTAGYGPPDDLKPAIAGAVALHLAVFAVLLWRPATPPGTGAAVPITLVTHGPRTIARPATAAPVEQSAQTPEPVPQAKAPEPPPPPTPRPSPAKAVAPPKPTASPTPRPKPTPQPPPKSRAAPTPKTDTFSLDSLQADINRTAKHSPPHPAFAARGPARAETASVARVDAGKGVSQSDVAGLAQLLTRLWNKSCDLDETVVVPVSFRVGDDGRLEGQVSAKGLESSHDPAVSVAARRAIDAVHKAAPYGPEFRNNSFTVNFDAKKACAS